MMQPERGVPASVKQRLLNVAHARAEEFEQVLVRFVVERFLWRLSQSRHADDFILKGAMLFVAWEGMPHRATRDLDLLGFGDPSTAHMSSVVKEIFAVAAEEDGLVFDSASVETDEIRSMQQYRGVRVSARATLGKARVRLQVDVGFGDAVTPEPEFVEFPSLLGLPSARVRAYPVETVIAEKALAMVEHGQINSRMKDYFDLLHLSNTRAFEGERLVRALAATSTRRGVTIPTGVVAGLSAAFAADPSKQAQWKAFCARLRMSSQTARLDDVVKSLALFLNPCFSSVARDEKGTGSWQPGGPWRV